MDKQKVEEIIQRLKDRGAALPCPRCGNNNFSVIEGFFSHPLQDKLAGLVIGGPSIPVAVTVCTKCGFLSEHALGTLGLLPPAEKEERK